MITTTPAVKCLVQACAAAAIGALDRTPAERVAKREYSNDRGVEWLLRGPSQVLDTASAPPLARTIVADVITAITPSSVAAKLFREGLQLSFDRAGTIAVPTLLGDMAYSGFVAEGKPIPVVETPLEPLVMIEPRKLATIVVLTSEMVRSSNIEVLITDGLVRSTSLALDRALFDDLAGDAARPAGLRHGVTPLAASTAPEPVAALMQDIENIRRAVGEIASAHPIYVMSKTRALLAQLRSTHGLDPLVVLGSRALRGTMIMLGIVPETLASVYGGAPDISATRESAMLMNSTPDESPPSRSLWQTDCVAILVRLPVSWAVRSPFGVAWLVTTNW